MDELSPPAEALPLSNAALPALSPAVVVPRYDRRALRPGIVHIGLGNFHRAHQSWYLHRLMQEGRAQDWAIIGAGVRPYDAEMRETLKAQDWLTTLIALDPGTSAAEVVGSMVDYVPVNPGHGPLIAAIAQPEIRIVSLTVTEGGYFRDPATGAFDPSASEIAADVANPAAPSTAFGAILAALAQRRAAGTGPITLQSCDNLQGNGTVLRETLLGLARLTDPGLADWVGEACSFPNAMVDCIVPATGPRERALAKRFGVADAAPVTHESFRQWVIEDDFCRGRPDWEDVGATLTDRVHDYEAMKIGLLNAGHQLLANAGEVLSCPTIASCMAHPGIAAFFRQTALREIAPHIAPVPEMTPEAYVTLIAGRFANPAIEDTTRRVAFDGSARHTGFLLPTLRTALETGAPLSGLCLGEALWARMCFGLREDGSEIAANDPQWETLQQAARAARDEPQAWLAQRAIYGDLASHPVFAERFALWLRQIWAEGTEAALSTYSAGG